MATELRSITEVSDAFAMPVSTLRYYDDIGLAPASCRQSRVRHYDHLALRRLAYVQLWRRGGLLGVRAIAGVLTSDNHALRNDLLREIRDDLGAEVRQLREAIEMISHSLECQEDDYNDCPVITAYLDQCVRVAFDDRPGATAAGAGVPDWRGLRAVAESVLGPLDPAGA